MFCLCSYRLLWPIHLVPSCSTAQSLRPWVLRHSLLSILQRTPVMLDLMFNNNHTIFTVIRKPLCVPLPLHSHLEVQWRRPVEYVPSLLSSTTRQAVRDTAGFVVRFLLIQVIHNVPNTIFDIIFKESNECKFLILQAMCYRNRKLKHE